LHGIIELNNDLDHFKSFSNIQSLLTCVTWKLLALQVISKKEQGGTKI